MNLLEKLQSKKPFNTEIKSLPIEMEDGVAILKSVEYLKSAKGNPYIKFSFQEKGTDESERRGVEPALTFSDIAKSEKQFDLLKYLFVSAGKPELLNDLVDIESYYEVESECFTFGEDDFDSKSDKSFGQQFSEYRDSKLAEYKGKDNYSYIEEIDWSNGIAQFVAIKLDKELMNKNARTIYKLFKELENEEFFLSTSEKDRTRLVKIESV